MRPQQTRSWEVYPRGKPSVVVVTAVSWLECVELWCPSRLYVSLLFFLNRGAYFALLLRNM